jgi:formylglycine-generating enzyme required for sulfatase activity
MSGNVSEWCNDWYLAYSDSLLKIDPLGLLTGSQRVVRGGSYKEKDYSQMSYTRIIGYPDRPSGEIGFRCVRKRL